MIVKRKLYSVMDEEGNQGYYLYNEATGEEKLFSDKNKKGEKKERKLKPLHKLNVIGYKLEGKLGRKLERQNLEGDWKGAGKSRAVGAGISTLAGAGIGAAIGGKKAALVGAKYGAGIGTAVALGGTLGTAAVKKLRKSSSRYDKAARQRLDEIALAEGKMTKEEYMDKWYKKD